MDLDIQFGDLEEAQPEVRLRPDRNKQIACVPYENPQEGELPIFVDLDVMRDMEIHAQSDTTVELGGVLLGGQYHDDEGRPFVVVNDSLRAEHYEATKGSFKFTHATWEQISRQRDEFPEDVQMVGWYHTHPDWGVFLSGMDMFICDNFFNRPLDLALVIDPCRGDRGMFQWTGDPAERVRRTGGFYLTASRFRQQELELFAAQLDGKFAMQTDPRLGGYPLPTMSAPAPIVNVQQPNNQWQGTALMGMLALQFVFLTLVAWKLFDPALGGARDDETIAQKLAAIERRLQEADDSETERAEMRARSDARDKLMKSLVAEFRDGETGRIQSDYVAAEEARQLAEAREKSALARGRELQRSVDEVKSQLGRATREIEERKRDIEELGGTNKKLRKERSVLIDEKKSLEDQLKVYQSKDGGDNMLWVYGGIGAAVLLIAVAGVVGMLIMRRREKLDADEEFDKFGQPREKMSPPDDPSVKIDDKPTNNEDEEPEERPR